MKKLKIFLIIISIFLFIVLCFFSFLFIAGKDEPKISDSDLKSENIIIRNEENAFSSLMEANNKIKSTKEEESELFTQILEKKDWSAKNMASIQSLINTDKEFFDIFDKAVALPKFQDEQCKDATNFNILSVLYSRPEFMRASKLALLKAIYLFIQGQEDRAISEALRVASLGHKIENSGCLLIIYLGGQAIKIQSLSIFIDFINKASLSSNDLKKYVPELLSLQDSSRGLSGALKLEYLSSINTKTKFLDEILAKAKMKFLSYIPYFYKPNKTERIIINHWRNVIDNANKEYYKDVKEESLNMDEILVPKGKFFVENLIGRSYLEVSLVSFSGAYSKMSAEKFFVLGSQTLLALKAYWQDFKKLPNSLAELVPNYLSEVPKDPFNGEFIKYSALNRIIYSVGKDLKDSNGISNFSVYLDSKYLDEPSVKIEFNG